jgi:streptogramin lyase
MKKKILPVLLCIMFLAWMIPVGTAQAASPWTNITGSGVFNSPTGVAVDNSGNVYVTNYGTNKIEELTNGSWTDITDSGGFYYYSSGVAVDNSGNVDSSGNVYVTDFNNNTIKELTNGTSSWKDIAGSGGFRMPWGVAVDNSGNVYVTDYGNNTIKELTHGSWTDITGSGVFSNPIGVAVDNSGNVYVANYGNGTIKELNHGSWTDITGSGVFNSPTGVAVDSSGNVYVTNCTTGKIKELAHGSSSWTDITDSGGFKWPWGVAVDSSGNVYATDKYNGTIMERPAPSADTAIMDTSADNGTVVTAISNTPPLSITVASGTTVDELTGAIQSTDGSTQTYTAVESDGVTSVTGTPISGDQLFVLSANGISAAYPITVTAPTADKSALESAITDATTLIGSLTVGTAAGDVLQADHDTYQAAIDAAQAVDTDGSAVQTDIDTTVLTLADATTAFNNAVILAPTVTGLSPTGGYASGDTEVTITGTNFTGVTAVYFGSTSANFTFNSDAAIDAASPPGTGTVDVTVVTPGGTSAVNQPDDQFTYTYPLTPTPTITTPIYASATSISGTTVVESMIAVEDSNGNYKDWFSADSSGDWTTDTSGLSMAAGDVITVFAKSNEDGESRGATTVVEAPPPTVTGVSPNNGPMSGGELITIYGSGFSGTDRVRFYLNDWYQFAAAYPIAFVNDTITCSLPPSNGISGILDTEVSSDGGMTWGTLNSADKFTYNPIIVTTPTLPSGTVGTAYTPSRLLLPVMAAAVLTHSVWLADYLQVSL